MATIVHTELLNGMVGGATHSTIDFDTDQIDMSLLDATDSGTITAATVDYDDVDTPTVVATTTNIMASGSISGGVVSLSGEKTFSSVSGDAADYLTVWKNTGTPGTSPLAITWDSATTGLPVTPNGADIDVAWSGNTLLTVA